MLPATSSRWRWREHVIELVVLAGFALYSVILLFVTSVYYYHLTLHCSADNAEGPNQDIRCKSNLKTLLHSGYSSEDTETGHNDRGLARKAKEIKKVYGLIFGDHLDAWRVLSILGMGYAILNIVATVAILLIFILSKETIAKDTHNRKKMELPRRSMICMRLLFGVCAALTLVFSIICFLTLLMSGAVNDEEPVERATQWARAYFGVVGIPGFSFLVLFAFALLIGFNCFWTSPINSLKKFGGSKGHEEEAGGQGAGLEGSGDELGS